jgi:hypothetical protein
VSSKPILFERLARMHEQMLYTCMYMCIKTRNSSYDHFPNNNFKYLFTYICTLNEMPPLLQQERTLLCMYCYKKAKFCQEHFFPS